MCTHTATPAANNNSSQTGSQRTWLRAHGGDGWWIRAWTWSRSTYSALTSKGDRSWVPICWIRKLGPPQPRALSEVWVPQLVCVRAWMGPQSPDFLPRTLTSKTPCKEAPVAGNLPGALKLSHPTSQCAMLAGAGLSASFIAALPSRQTHKLRCL